MASATTRRDLRLRRSPGFASPFCPEDNRKLRGREGRNLPLLKHGQRCQRPSPGARSIRVIKDIITRIGANRVTTAKKEILVGLIESARKFRFCSPSDDLEEVWGVTTGYRSLFTQIKRL